MSTVKVESIADLVELPKGTVLNGKFKLIERTLKHPILGIQYNAINQQGEGFIIKMDDENNSSSPVKIEAGFLHMALMKGLANNFVEFVHGGRVKKMMYFVSRFRCGPSINDCLCAIPSGKFTIQTASRVAYYIFKAVENLHSLGYILRRIDPNVIKYDIKDRTIYLSDLSSVRIDPQKSNGAPEIKWAGSRLYAPIHHHGGGTMAAYHDLEPIIYLLVEMTTGHLPWETKIPELVEVSKRTTIEEDALFRECPVQYNLMFNYVSSLTKDDKIDYEMLYSKLEEVWKQHGATSVSAPWDWEKILQSDSE